MNSWDDQNVRDALAANGRKKIVVAGLWTEAVSYTHLDVYKRQPTPYPVDNPCPGKVESRFE